MYGNASERKGEGETMTREKGEHNEWGLRGVCAMSRAARVRLCCSCCRCFGVSL